MIERFCKWMTSPEDLPGLIARMLAVIILTAIILTVALAFTFAPLAFLILLSL